MTAMTLVQVVLNFSSESRSSKQGQSFEVTGTGLDMLTETGALKSLADIDAAITQVSSFRASFGAVENRIDAAINNKHLEVKYEASQSKFRMQILLLNF